MGRAFSGEEKKRVKERLLSVGEELFSRFGLKKTSIEEITDTAGIGRGSFYLFFPSKEFLYIEVIEMVAERVQRSIIEQIAKNGREPEVILKAYLNRIFRLAEENPLLKVLFSRREELDGLVDNLPRERIASFLVNNDRVIHRTVEVMKDIGVDLDIPVETFSAMVRGFNLITQHKEIVGSGEFDNVFTFIADAVAGQILTGIKTKGKSRT
ncbi:MAG: TetR/AcrR family transcriptional regulator [Chitinispirillaceae bacterium]|nr:TetR/AcrR family transcriptional regulator [Chitinispirillaceae bacterium]